MPGSNDGRRLPRSAETPTLTIANTATGQSREVAADDEGRYLIVNVLPGIYDLKVSARGFKTLTRSGMEVTINTVARADVKLEVGGVTEQVTVEASAAVLQTDKADVHVELVSQVITTLPLPNYRNYQSLINLVPGATPAGFQNAVIDTPGRALTTNINGTNRNNNTTKLDGAANINLWLPHHVHYVPPAETVETVNITTNKFDAERDGRQSAVARKMVDITPLQARRRSLGSPAPLRFTFLKQREVSSTTRPMIHVSATPPKPEPIPERPETEATTRRWKKVRRAG